MLLFISTTALLKVQEGRGKDANWTQVRRSADAERRRGRIAEAPRSMDA